MPTQPRIMPGAAVEATDGRFGVVRDVILQPGTGALSYLAVHHDGKTVSVPASQIDTIVSPVEVRLNLTRDAARARASGVIIEDGDRVQVRIPLHEERLRVDTRPVDLGELRIEKVVDTTEQTVKLMVERDDLDIERVRVDRPIEEPVGARQEGDWLVVPIMEEVLVVKKQLMLVEEVRIRTRRVTEEREVSAPVRREHVAIEGASGVGESDATGNPSDTPVPPKASRRGRSDS